MTYISSERSNLILLHLRSHIADLLYEDRISANRGAAESHWRYFFFPKNRGGKVYRCGPPEGRRNYGSRTNGVSEEGLVLLLLPRTD